MLGNNALERRFGHRSRQIATLLSTIWVYGRHELLYLCWALMELALITPVALAIMPWARYWPSTAVTLWLLLLLFIPFNLNRLLSLARVPLSRQQFIALAVLVLTQIFAMRTLLYETSGLFDLSWLSELYRHFSETDNPLWARDLTLFFLIAFVWWRGLTLTNRPVDIDDVGLRMRVGGLILAPLVVGVTMLPHSVSALPFVLLFFLASLMAIALTRAEQISLERQGQNYPMQPRWVGVIFLTSLLVVLISGFLAVIASGRGLDLFFSWLAPLWQALRYFMTVFIATVTYLALFILSPLEALLRALMSGVDTIPLLEPQTAQEFERGDDIERLLLQLGDSPSLFWLNRILTILVIVGVVLLLTFIISRYFRNRELALAPSERPLYPGEAEAEPVGLGGRLLRRLGLWRKWRAAASIRRLYYQMCAAAEVAGYPRALSETPYEYLATLQEAWPEGTNETRLITQAYVRVRYGELPETDEEMAEIQEAWKRLQEMKREG